MNNESSAIAPRRAWVMVAIIGCALVILGMLAALLAMVDKKHFGSFVGTEFLFSVAGGVLVGSLMVFVAALVLPNRTNWRSVVLVVWGLIGITSPFFGFLFLLPWGTMAVLLPGVIVALTSLYHASS